MSVTVENGQYVVIIPEQSLHQTFNPDVNPPRPFATEQEALAWQQTFLDSITIAQANHQAAVEAAELAKQQARKVIHVSFSDSSPNEGVQIQVSVAIKDGTDTIIPLTDQFRVPIENDVGDVVRIKKVNIVNGAATVNLTFAKSGYYRITEQGINRRLPDNMKMELPGGYVELTVNE